jgi:hypothetical protein
MKWMPGTVTSAWSGQVRQKSRTAPVRMLPGSALMNSLGSSDRAGTDLPGCGRLRPGTAREQDARRSHPSSSTGPPSIDIDLSGFEEDPPCLHPCTSPSPYICGPGDFRSSAMSGAPAGRAAGDAGQVRCRRPYKRPGCGSGGGPGSGGPGHRVVVRGSACRAAICTSRRSTPASSMVRAGVRLERCGWRTVLAAIGACIVDGAGRAPLTWVTDGRHARAGRDHVNRHPPAMTKLQMRRLSAGSRRSAPNSVELALSAARGRRNATWSFRLVR